MSGRNFLYDDLPSLGKGFPPVMLRETERLAGSIHLSLHQNAVEALHAATPRLTGETSTLVQSDPINPENATEALQTTRVGYGGTPAQRRKANALNIGRRSTQKPYTVNPRTGKAYQVQRRVIGSKQAPKGMKGPVLRQLKAREQEILAAAIDRVDR